MDPKTSLEGENDKGPFASLREGWDRLMVRVHVARKPDYREVRHRVIRQALHQAGLQTIEGLHHEQVYFLDGPISPAQTRQIASQILCDPIVEEFAINRLVDPGVHAHAVFVMKRKGVMDPVEASVIKAAGDLRCPLTSVKLASLYQITGRGFTRPDVHRAIARSLANETIEEIVFHDEPMDPFARPDPYVFRRVEVALLGLDERELTDLSQRHQLALNLREMKALQAYFRSLKRNPTDVELETFAQTWSEHCVHKTLKGKIAVRDKVYQNLLQETIVKATREADKDWCVSVFQDNAGIVCFDEHFDVTFKVETHNHPSAVDPYGGAGTGLGGVVRDTLGTGLGAKPIAGTDVFCLADVRTPDARVPDGSLHPRRILHGVVSGVRDYGNRMGIPTVNGAICFDQGYLGNPLVFCGSVGLIPRGHAVKAPRKGDHIVVIGGATGRDGIHGATFSSLELDQSSEATASDAVQIGNAITEKMMQDVLLKARDRGLYHAVTDCGAGGFSSAVGEMGEHLGAEVHLEKAPLKYEGLSYTEIWISEAQERMVLAVPAEDLQELFALCDAEGVVAADIGVFTGTGRLVLQYHGNLVCDLDMHFLHRGLPPHTREAVYPDPIRPRTSAFPSGIPCGDLLHRLLREPNIASKEWVIRQYDHEVQAGGVLKPLQGVDNDGPGDAAVVAPVPGSRKAVAIACGINIPLGKLDPFQMACAAIDEAIRQLVAVGSDPERIALLDNFCWGDTSDPEQLGALVRACEGCYQAARWFDLPFVSGKDSLNNVYRTRNRRICIPHTLLISALGVIDDFRMCISMDLKSPGNLIYMLGNTYPGMGGSLLYDSMQLQDHRIPRLRGPEAKILYQRLHRGIKQGWIRSCHDLSEGGLAVAAAEMAFAGNIGMTLQLDAVPQCADPAKEELLFCESPSRFLVEVEQASQAAFETCLEGVPFARIGRTSDVMRLRIRHHARTVLDEDLDGLKQSWQSTLGDP